MHRNEPKAKHVPPAKRAGGEHSSHKGGFIDNNMTHDNHQRGIERVKNIGKEMHKGQGGKMGKVEKAHWHRGGGSQTPKSA
jgi:hypothetical protein